MQPLGKHADPDRALWKDLDPEPGVSNRNRTGYKNVKIKFMNCELKKAENPSWVV